MRRRNSSSPKSRFSQRKRCSHVAVIDLCCGIGGLSIAARQLGMQIIAGVDTEADALKTFGKNFPNADSVATAVGKKATAVKCRASISSRGLQEAKLVVVSGPPCQGFSVAGSRDPKDRRNKVLIAVGQLVKQLKPSCALIENVETLLAKRYRPTIRALKRHLREAGYHLTIITANAKDFGVAQNRSRAFLLVTLRPLDKSRVLARLVELRRPRVIVKEALALLPKAKVRGVKYKDDMPVKGPLNHLAMRHSMRVQRKIAKILAGAGPMSYRKLDPEKIAKTLYSGHRAPPAHFIWPRSVTVREAARLQGIPDSFRIYGAFANQMGQVTNAVPPPLGRCVLRVLMESSGLLNGAHG